MKIPDAKRAVIDPAKLHGYLLSPSHPIGRFKAAFFRSLGYTPENWRLLEADFRKQHLEQDAEEGVSGEYGRRYVIRATLTGPLGRAANVVSVWVVLKGEEVPRFVTAYPGADR